MRLIIYSPVEAVLDLISIKVLFVNSYPLAVVKRISEDKDQWEAYSTHIEDKEVADLVKCWVSDYISTACDLRNLSEVDILQIIREWSE